jgi:hypothetical protein
MQEVPSIPLISRFVFGTHVGRLHTTFNVGRVDPHIAVPVRPALLMPASQSVKHLVYHNPFTLTASSNRDVLLAMANSTDI